MFAKDKYQGHVCPGPSAEWQMPKISQNLGHSFDETKKKTIKLSHPLFQFLLFAFELVKPIRHNPW